MGALGGGVQQQGLQGDGTKKNDDDDDDVTRPMTSSLVRGSSSDLLRLVLNRPIRHQIVASYWTTRVGGKVVVAARSVVTMETVLFAGNTQTKWTTLTSPQKWR